MSKTPVTKIKIKTGRSKGGRAIQCVDLTLSGDDFEYPAPPAIQFVPLSKVSPVDSPEAECLDHTSSVIKNRIRLRQAKTLNQINKKQSESGKKDVKKRVEVEGRDKIGAKRAPRRVEGKHVTKLICSMLLPEATDLGYTSSA